MEFSVYDKLTRKLCAVIGIGFLIPIIGVFAIFSMIPGGQKMPPEICILLGAMTVFMTGLSAVMAITTNVRIKIDQGAGNVFRTYGLGSWVVRRQEYPLSQFSRVSLHRGFRGGYMATLVGQDKEIILCFNGNLGTARKAAEDAAGFTCLPLNDQV